MIPFVLNASWNKYTVNILLICSTFHLWSAEIKKRPNFRLNTNNKYKQQVFFWQCKLKVSNECIEYFFLIKNDLTNFITKPRDNTNEHVTERPPRLAAKKARLALKAFFNYFCFSRMYCFFSPHLMYQFWLNHSLYANTVMKTPILPMRSFWYRALNLAPPPSPRSDT